MNLDELNTTEIIQAYSGIVKQLKKRGVIRTKNLVGDLGEYLAIEHFNNTAGMSNLKAAPAGTQNIDAISRNGDRFSIKSTTRNLTGVFYGEDGKSYNSVQQIGSQSAVYKKRHLVPFGEFMPFRFLLEPINRFINIPMSDLSAGDGPHTPLAIAGELIGISICYEDVFGEEMRAVLPDATVLINVSNDAWFGTHMAPHQHEQKARMRAREFERPLVRVTNTGVSSAIDYQGNILGRIKHDTKGILDVQVQPRDGATLYARTGNWPVFLFSLFVVIMMFAFGRARRV